MKRPRNSHQGSPENRQTILEATAAIALESGYEGTKMSEVARASGLPVGSVYWHFENKETLFVAMLDYCFETWKKAQIEATSLRDVLFLEASRAAQISTTQPRDAQSFRAFALILALEKRLVDDAARQRYLEIRKEMYGIVFDHLEGQLRETALHDEVLVRNILALGRSIIDGFFIAASAGEDVDFEACAELAASALEGLLANSSKVTTHV